MKKLYLFILVFVMWSQVHSQGYFPMLDSISNNWYYVSGAIPVRMASSAPDCDYASASFNYTSDHVYTTGDTVINSFSYKKVEQEQALWSGSLCTFGYLREDTATSRIYFMDNLFSPEILLYDYSLQVGDSIYYDFVVQGFYYTDGYFTVDSISMVNIQAGPRRLFYLNNHSAPFQPFPLEWIESVGHPGHVIFTHSANEYWGGGLFSMCNDYLIRDYYQSLTCFEHSSQKVFFDSCAHAQAVNNMCFFYADSCNFWNICGSLDENGLISEFVVSPNPSSSEVTLIIEANRSDKAVLNVYDIAGKLMFTGASVTSKFCFVSSF